MKERVVLIRGSAFTSIMEYARACHPKEGILLLRGKIGKERIMVDEVEIPPLAVHGSSYSSFPIYMLPIDLSTVGTAHSHPIGFPKPSVGDMNNYYGRVMIIVAYPYRSEQNMGVFNSKGDSLRYELTEDD
ncbi:MAG: Mov34/MPN/PAD-1 family protein [Candidatus Bathyarchaeota archaeon]|nr:MAG: Mov34/MPN/PAD-1 family protein [Candidatus Bathyarchaeota archaeon]